MAVMIQAAFASLAQPPFGVCHEGFLGAELVVTHQLIQQLSRQILTFHSLQGAHSGPQTSAYPVHFVLAGPQCNASVDLIGTCWPRSAVGQLVARPCPEYFYGVRYNTTSKRGSTAGDTLGEGSDIQETIHLWEQSSSTIKKTVPQTPDFREGNFREAAL